MGHVLFSKVANHAIDRIWLAALCRAGIAACFVVALSVAPSLSFAAVTNGTDANIKKVTGADTISKSAEEGLRVVSGVHDVSVTAHGLCRFVDVKGNADIFVPFKKLVEWQSFISSRAGTFTLDFCRPEETFTVNYLPGLSTGAVISATNVNPTSKAVTMPLVRLDTRSQSILDAALVGTDISPDLAVERTDCLGNITYPDGSVRNPCVKWTWLEKVTANLRYTLNAGYDTLSNLQAHVNEFEQSKVGAWGVKDYSTNACSGLGGTTSGGGGVPTNGCVPAVKPPELLSCPVVPANHAELNWVDLGYRYEALACPSGTISSGRQTRYMVQLQYQCFDGTNYPLVTQRDKPGSATILGDCLPIVNGACGSANGTPVNSAPTSGLCSTGTASSVSGTGPWSWQCTGENTGTTASCSASVACNSYNVGFTTSCSAIGLGGGNSLAGYNTYCATYSWQTGSWSGWDSCYNSSQSRTRSVTCVSSQGQSVADSYCTDTKPATTQYQSCYSPTTGPWTADGWGSCQGTCDWGTQYRNVHCDYDSCTGAQPATSQSCALTACPEPTSGPWSSGGWGSCDADCGGGTQYRDVWCDYDSCYGGMPSSSRSCNTQACAPTCSSPQVFSGWTPIAGWGGCGAGSGWIMDYHVETWVMDGSCNPSYKIDDQITDRQCGCYTGVQETGCPL